MSEAGLVMKYFILKPHGTNAFAEASRKAMRAYAISIGDENNTLCNELLDWVDREDALAANALAPKKEEGDGENPRLHSH